MCHKTVRIAHSDNAVYFPLEDVITYLRNLICILKKNMKTWKVGEHYSIINVDVFTDVNNLLDRKFICCLFSLVWVVYILNIVKMNLLQ